MPAQFHRQLRPCLYALTRAVLKNKIALYFFIYFILFEALSDKAEK
jgi:hypothetical protein